MNEGVKLFTFFIHVNVNVRGMNNILALKKTFVRKRLCTPKYTSYKQSDFTKHYY